jgi:hypothetical protein
VQERLLENESENMDLKKYISHERRACKIWLMIN